MSLEDEVNFCLKLLSLLDFTNSSTIFSPASILNSLAMVHAGTKGKSAEEIAAVIGKDKTAEEIMEYYSEFVKRHEASAEKDKTKAAVIPANRKRKHLVEGTSNVNIANGFFVSDAIKLVETYEKLMKEKFNGKIQSTNFCKAAKAVKEINNFVADSTNNAIKKILTPVDITPDTSVVLINAIHFIGFWEEPFSNRRKQKFNSNPPREIPMMSKCIESGKYDWNIQEGEDWECLGIPYKNRKSWLYIVLPRKIDGLETLIKKVDYSFIQKCTERRKTNKMTVIIPIIDISSTINLEEKLQALGIKEVFSDEANLSGMLNGLNKIQKAIHKAVIKIDEKGTVASAATGIQMVARCAPQPFYATHPFLFFITSVEGEDSTASKDILFMGTFC